MNQENEQLLKLLCWLSPILGGIATFHIIDMMINVDIWYGVVLLPIFGLTSCIWLICWTYYKENVDVIN